MEMKSLKYVLWGCNVVRYHQTCSPEGGDSLITFAHSNPRKNTLAALRYREERRNALFTPTRRLSSSIFVTVFST